MKYTNKYKLPEYVKKWLLHDEYDYEEGVISATSLLKPTRMIILEMKNRHKLTLDISELLALRRGTAIHDSIEKVGLGENFRQEERVYVECLGKKLSGKFDILQLHDDGTATLIDVKTTSVWSFIFKSRNNDYMKQLSIYRWLLASNAYPTVTGAKIWYHFTDWQKSKAKVDSSYPSLPIAIRDLPLLSLDLTEEMVKNKIKELEINYAKAQDDLPFCTDDELWKEQDKFAVMKRGRKTACKLLDSEIAAKGYINNQGKEGLFYIEKREGKTHRCDYCNVKEICNQRKEILTKEKLK